MAKEYTTFESMFKDIEKDINKSLKNVTKQLLEIWKNLVEDNFYAKYEPYAKIEENKYPRTWQSIDAIVLLDVKDNEVTLGYDTSVFETFRYGVNNQFVGHGKPEWQPNFVEYGFTMRDGSKREGAHAFEYMLDYVQSDDFVALFNAEMNKLGYSMTYKL